MGPLFAIAIIAISSAAILGGAFIALKVLRANYAFRGAVGFVIGTGLGAIASVAVLAAAIGIGAKLETSQQVIAYFSAVTVGALAGGLVLSWLGLRVLRRP